jgi:hypothetical protein
LSKYFPALALSLALGLLSCRSSAPVSSAAFRDAAEETGLTFRHQNGMTGKRYMLEVNGPGVALLDYDNDGDLDVFLVQSGPIGGADSSGARCRLFRNDLRMENGRRRLKFTDVTVAAGLDLSLYGQGAVAGDFDHDGWVDLFVTAYGRNHLLRNQGNGTFVDVTTAAGVAGDDVWHTSAAWVDFDRDGFLDLFVCQYIQWGVATHRTCRSRTGAPDYCGPQVFPKTSSSLYRNLGDGKFADVSAESGVAAKSGAALGVIASDIDADGLPDLFVTNDGMANFLWRNRGNGTFAEEGMLHGVALNGNGEAEANMGIIAADFANHGLIDLFVTHIRGEHSTFFRNLGGGQFEDSTSAAGLDAATRPFTGFGTVAVDYDNDGWLDIFAANGEVRVIDAQARAGDPMPIRQRAYLFRNLGGERTSFAEVTNGDFLKIEDIGRGVAVGDLDNDGWLDIIVANNNGSTRLLLNQSAERHVWIGFRLVQGPPGHRVDAIGAVATLHRQGRPSQTRRVAADGSFLSSSDPRAHFGLGDSPAYDAVTVKWPDGSEEEWRGLPPGRYHELARGGGSPIVREANHR